MRIFGKVLQTLRLSRRQSNFKPRRNSSFLCYHNFTRRSPINNNRVIKNVSMRTVASKSDPPSKGTTICKGNIANILPVALIQSKSTTATTKIMLIPLNLFDGDDDANNKTMKTLSVIREHARQIEAFTENLMDTSDTVNYNVHMTTNNARTLLEQYDDVTMWSHDDASNAHSLQSSNYQDHFSSNSISLYENLERAVAEQEMNRLEADDCYDVAAWNSTKKDLVVFVPESLEEKLQQMAISSMQLAFEMDMSNIRDAILRSAALKNINLFKPPTPKTLHDPTLTMKTSLELENSDAKNTIPLDFNALIQGTVEIDPSKYTPANLGEIKVPEFNDCVTAIAANICSTALQKGFPADISRMAYSTNTPAAKKDVEKQRDPHIVCEREGDKGCISPGNAEYPNFVPKGAAGASGGAAGGGSGDKAGSACISSEISLLSSSEIIGYNSRGLMSCKAYAMAVAEATKRRAEMTKAEPSEKGKAEKKEATRKKKDKCDDPMNNPCTKPLMDECGNEVKKDCPKRKKPKKKKKDCDLGDPCKKADSGSEKPSYKLSSSKKPCGDKKKKKDKGGSSDTTGCGKPKGKKSDRCHSETDACKIPKECPKPKKKICDLGDPCDPCPKPKKEKPKPKKTCASATPVLYSAKCPLPGVKAAQGKDSKCAPSKDSDTKSKSVKSLCDVKKSKSTGDVKKTANKCEPSGGQKRSSSSSSKPPSSKCQPFNSTKKDGKPKKSASDSKCGPPKKSASEAKKSASDSKCGPPKKSASEAKKSASDSKCGPPKKSASEGKKSASDSKCGPPKKSASEAKKSASDSKCGPPKKSASDKKGGDKPSACKPPGSNKKSSSNKDECKRYEGFCTSDKKSACSKDKKKSSDKSGGECKEIKSLCDVKKSKSSGSTDKKSACGPSSGSGAAKKAKSTKSACDVKKSKSSSSTDKKSACDPSSGSGAAKKAKSTKSACDVKKSKSSSSTDKKSACGPSSGSGAAKKTKSARSLCDVKKSASSGSTDKKTKSTNSVCDVKKSKSSASTDKKSACGPSSGSPKKSKSKSSVCDTKSKSKSPSSSSGKKSACGPSSGSSSGSGKKSKPIKSLCDLKKSTSSSSAGKKTKKARSLCDVKKTSSKSDQKSSKQAAKGSDKKSAKSSSGTNTDCKAKGKKKPTAPNCKPKSGSGSGKGSSTGSGSACKKFSTVTNPKPIIGILPVRRFFSNIATYKIPFGLISWRQFGSKKGSKGKKKGNQSSAQCMKQAPKKRSKRVDVLARKKPKDCFTDEADMCGGEKKCKDPMDSDCNKDRKENENPSSLSLKTCLHIAGPLSSLKKRYYGTGTCKKIETHCCNEDLMKNNDVCNYEDEYESDECDENENENEKNLITNTRNEVIRIMEPCTVERCLEAIPNYSEYDVLVRTAAVALSGSDLHYYETGGRSYPGMTLGHDATGVVEEVGCSITKIRPGDRVVVESGLACGICDYCKRGCYNICNQLIFNGFLRKYQVHPADLCHKIPDDVDLIEATLTQTLALGCQACFKAQVLPTTNVLVIGASPTALSTALCARAIGVGNICIASTMKDPLEMIENTFNFNCMHYEQDMQYKMILQCLYSVLHDWPDAVINCAISEKTMNLAVMALKPCGICVMAECDAECACFNAIDVLMKNLKLLPSFRSINMFPTALSLIEGGKAPIGRLVAKVYEWQEVEMAFRKALCESNIGNKKVIVRCAEEEEETYRKEDCKT